MFPSSRIIAVAPGLQNDALISNILSCGIYDIVNDNLDSLTDAQRIASVCRIVDTIVDHPKTFADIYGKIQWQVPVLESNSNEPKGFFARRKAKKEQKKADKQARKEAKLQAKNAVPEVQIDPYEAFLNGATEPVMEEVKQASEEEISAVDGGFDDNIEYVENLDDLFE